MQAGGGRRYRSPLLGEDGLVSLAISVRVIAMNIGREWHMANAIEDGEEIVDRGELEQPIAELSALKDFGFENNGAVGSREHEAFADGNFSSGAHERAPEVVSGGLGEHDFDSAGGLFAFAAQRSARVEASGDHATVIEHEQVAGVEKGREVGELAVVQFARCTIHDEHAALSALLGRLLRNQLRQVNRNQSRQRGGHSSGRFPKMRQRPETRALDGCIQFFALGLKLIGREIGGDVGPLRPAYDDAREGLRHQKAVP